MKQVIAAMLFICSAGGAWAQASPIGLWKNFDEKTNVPKSEVRITEQGGIVSGRVERVLLQDAAPDAVCTECTDDRKGQPVKGLEIIRGAQKVEGKNVWEGGKVLDPENGKNYTLRLTPVDGGNKLEVRGSIGPFGRTQTWVRVQ